MTINEVLHISNARFLLANGSTDTLKNKAGQQYNGISLKEIAERAKAPTSEEKSSAPFFIPSTYRDHDGRSHEVQRERGEYWMLAVDIDEGNIDLAQVTDALKQIIGNAAYIGYTTSSATEMSRKSRVLIPLSRPLSGADYEFTQLALFELMAERGVTCDGALARCGQPIYLPNVPTARRFDGEPLYYVHDVNRGKHLFDVFGSDIEALANRRKQEEAEAQRQAEIMRQRRQEERERRRLERPMDVSPVEEFNARHNIDALLERYGYTQQGRSSNWRSPMQSTGSYATRAFETHWVSLSNSDAAAGIGTSKGGFTWGDAFDLYVYFEHGGDYTKAVREYGREIEPADPFRKNNADDFREAQKAALERKVDPEPVAVDPFEDAPACEVSDGGEIDPDAIEQSSGIILPDAKPKAKIFWPDDAIPQLDNSYLVKGWLGAGQMAVLYGPSNVGKSFFALDLSFCLGAGIEWRGCKTNGGVVLYLATEGGQAFHNRVYALKQQYEGIQSKLAVRPSPVDLLRPQESMPELIELCAEIEQEHGKIAMIVVDTLSRAMAGGNENGPEDMTAFISNCDVLREATGATILTVHHSGKDAAQGARGHSSLRAATDTEIELQYDPETNIRAARATKQRDMEGNRELVFKLKVHELGEDSDGDMVTTCTIDIVSDEEKRDAGGIKAPKGMNQKALIEAFMIMRNDHIGVPNPSGIGFPDAGKYHCIEEDRFREFAIQRLGGANPATSYRKAFEGLIEGGFMAMNQGLVWIAARKGRCS